MPGRQLDGTEYRNESYFHFKSPQIVITLSTEFEKKRSFSLIVIRCENFLCDFYLGFKCGENI